MVKNQSDIARIREQIDTEIAAMHLALHGYAITARHDFINSRLEQLGDCIERLRPHVGERQAVEIVIAALDKEPTQ